MPLFTDLATHLARAAHLLALSLAPFGLSPEPPPSERPLVAGVFSLAAIVFVLAGAAWMRIKLRSRLGSFAAGLAWFAVAAAIAGTLVCNGRPTPLGRAIPLVAPFAW